jgi:solute carrier family 25 protein 34/35
MHSEITGGSPNNFFVGMASGAASGIVGSMVANPFYIAKTRLQSYSPHMPVGHQHSYNGN